MLEITQLGGRMKSVELNLLFHSTDRHYILKASSHDYSTMFHYIPVIGRREKVKEITSESLSMTKKSE